MLTRHVGGPGSTPGIAHICNLSAWMEEAAGSGVQGVLASYWFTAGMTDGACYMFTLGEPRDLVNG